MTFKRHSYEYKEWTILFSLYLTIYTLHNQYLSIHYDKEKEHSRIGGDI